MTPDKQIIIDKIRRQGLQPIPRWHFVVKDWLKWSGFLGTMILGGLAFSIILFQISEVEWDIYPYLDYSWGRFVFVALPYLWIILLAISLTLAHVNLKNTKHGYKYHPLLIWGGNILASLLIGATLFSSGAATKVERTLERSPIYKNLRYDREKIWSLTEKGLLAGRVIEVIEPGQIKLQDLEGNEWTVDVGGTPLENMSADQINNRIKIIGEKRKERGFQAKDIRPWDRNKSKEAPFHLPTIPRPPR